MRRTYAGEMTWAIEQALMRNHDRNPNRAAQVTAALEYGLAVARSRRDPRVPMPDRPTIEDAI